MSECEGPGKVSYVASGDKFCANCVNYGWKQPADKNILKRCSKCKFLYYCSKECQVEHWVKVHKQHCKYLAELKVMAQSRHDPLSCPGCKEEAKVGPVEMAKQDNPTLGCPLATYYAPLVFLPDYGDGNKTSAPLPFKLGEMTGQFLTKAEHTVSLMMRILYKMKVTKHAAWTIKPEASLYIYRMVNALRNNIWVVYISANPGQRLDDLLAANMEQLVDKMISCAEEIDEKLTAVQFLDQSLFRPWDMFKLLLNIAREFRFDVVRKAAESVGLAEDHQMRVTSSQFNSMWQEVLDSMPGHLIPYTDILHILCGGQLTQVCFGCAKEITVSDVLLPTAKQHNPAVSYHCYGVISASVCGDADCVAKVGQAARALVKSYMEIFSSPWTTVVTIVHCTSEARATGAHGA
eukprot:GFUD01038674.1.p1 GENE.GFUD01038674.1~~GFUD01038674.1.p1  ORF type:complete len:406 (-),score=128.53 GFUD01038674.1:125-1342(-)